MQDMFPWENNNAMFWRSHGCGIKLSIKIIALQIFYSLLEN